MEQWFTTFNEQYFDGGLPLPRLALSRSKTRLGSMSCKRVTRLLRGTKFSDFTIRLSNYYDLSERDFQNVLLHEMIHYHIAYTELKTLRHMESCSEEWLKCSTESMVGTSR